MIANTKPRKPDLLITPTINGYLIKVMGGEIPMYIEPMMYSFESLDAMIEWITDYYELGGQLKENEE